MLGSLLVIYFFNIHALPLEDLPFVKNIISFLNIGMVGFVTSAVALRFVFPSVSLEGRGFWIIKSSPIRIRSLLWEKFWICIVPFILLSGVIVVVSNLILEVDTFIFVILCSQTIICF